MFVILVSIIYDIIT